MNHLFVPTNFNDMNEQSKITYGQLPIMRFFQGVKSIIIIMTFYRLLFINNFIYLFFYIVLKSSIDIFQFLEVYRAC